MLVYPHFYFCIPKIGGGSHMQDAKKYIPGLGTAFTISAEDVSGLPTDDGGADVVNWNDIQGKPTTFAPATHTHTIANVTNLQTTLDGKAASSHTHTIANITSLQTTLDGKLTASKAATQANSTATDVAGVVADLNALIAKLKAAGIML
jgi:hypothetical protein